MTIITAGHKYIDIDVIASAVALRELMQLQGKRASIHLTGPYNATVPQSLINDLDDSINRTPPVVTEKDRFVLVDISNPTFVESFVSLDQVIAVYDHHFGYESFWAERLGALALIQPIGACATLIWEEICKADVSQHISALSLRLLYTAIVSNTLNFKATVCTARDITAAKTIASYAQVSDDFIDQYYQEVDAFLAHDIQKALRADTKTAAFQGQDFHFSQIEVWDATTLFAKHDVLQLMSQTFTQGFWLLNLVCIKTGCSYLFTNAAPLKSFLQLQIDGSAEKNYWRAKQLWLRKSILKLMLLSG